MPQVQPRTTSVDHTGMAPCRSRLPRERTMAAVGDYVQHRKKALRGEVMKKDDHGWCVLYSTMFGEPELSEEHERDLIVIVKGK